MFSHFADEPQNCLAQVPNFFIPRNFCADSDLTKHPMDEIHYDLKKHPMDKFLISDSIFPTLIAMK